MIIFLPPLSLHFSFLLCLIIFLLKVCGHRYVRKVNNDQTWGMIGRCYIRSNNMQYDDTDSHWQDYYEVCSPYDLQKQEGLCNMGISAAITETEVVVGTPGSFEWQGL